jgi:hypothetical protein
VYLDQPDGWQVSKACLDRSYTDLPTQPLDEWLGSAPGLLDAIQAGALVEHLVRRPGSVPPTTVRAAFRNYQHLPRGPRPGLSASRAVRATRRSLPTVSKTPEDDAHSRRPQLTLPATETYTHRGAIIVSRTTSTPVAAASNTINIRTRAGSPTTLQIRATKVCGSSVRILIGSRGRPDGLPPFLWGLLAASLSPSRVAALPVPGSLKDTAPSGLPVSAGGPLLMRAAP